jgi:hypothetical protein
MLYCQNKQYFSVLPSILLSGKIAIPSMASFSGKPISSIGSIVNSSMIV